MPPCAAPLCWCAGCSSGPCRLRTVGKLRRLFVLRLALTASVSSAYPAYRERSGAVGGQILTVLPPSGEVDAGETASFVFLVSTPGVYDVHVSGSASAVLLGGVTGSTRFDSTSNPVGQIEVTNLVAEQVEVTIDGVAFEVPVLFTFRPAAPFKVHLALQSDSISVDSAGLEVEAEAQDQFGNRVQGSGTVALRITSSIGASKTITAILANGIARETHKITSSDVYYLSPAVSPVVFTATDGAHNLVFMPTQTNLTVRATAGTSETPACRTYGADLTNPLVGNPLWPTNR